MAQICVLVAGVMLCSLPACSLARNLPEIQSLENKEIVRLLRQMKRTPLHSCLKDSRDFKLPWKRANITKNQTAPGPCCYHQMLQQISQVFSTEHSHAAWDNTSLHKLLSSLDHSQDQLEQTEEGNLDCPFWGTAVREYFQAIHLYLKEKEYSPCAWEIVREETKKRLSFMKHPKWKA
ncbi:LOW QUALITY PROTEIN: interferon alpha-14-like [Camelus ferus]|uniref:LOW QUALITY PROTEIN: interferon alpha-14-like n=2 Tax=Camelus TaxID=9836 RepID=A0A8B8SYA2_CAMFR|nr:LOW QUALITY PROTEIN: interferon alpha-14-like [Camelus ferus]XP_045365835.1 LOW QUALITY PROTEIN: interferon alpha-14-like [Camelus bactrianus]